MVNDALLLQKSLKSQKDVFENAIKNLMEVLPSNDSGNALLLREARIIKLVEKYRQDSNIKKVIDTFNDLSQAEKAKIFDDVLLRVKGRKAKNNPYGP